MCGIVAIVGDSDGSTAPLIERMRDSIAHRGPDDAGVHVEEGVALGHRRLSIIDLSVAGHQPMSNEDGTLVLVFNGEIYNYVELREELRAKGCTFRSQSDSEVLLRLYEHQGETCVDRLRGMFAFAIWDRRRRRLFAARDRLGKKPLYYAPLGWGLALASEIKALLQHPRVRATPDREALHHYLALQYIPSPLTALEGIKRLPPAHTLSWQGGSLTIRRYWQLEYLPKCLESEDDTAEALEASLRDSVRIRLRADVPVGVMLSGGLDSSLVTALAAQHASRLKTFTIGFEDVAYDERAPARLVAARFGAEHHEIEARADLVQLLPKLVRQYDQPFADPAALPTMILSELTRRHVKVALNGDGGDEAFGGYGRYRSPLHWRAFRRLPRLLREYRVWDGAAGLAGLLSTQAAARVRRVWDLGNERRDELYARSMSHFNREWLRKLVSDDLRTSSVKWDVYRPLREAFAVAEQRGLGPLDTLLSVDSVTYLPDCLLVKVDMASMAHGLEVRSPLLDQDFVAQAARLPEAQKVRGRETKYLLRKVARRHLPAEIVDRPKAGFGVPLARWLRTDLKALVQDTLLDGRLARRGCFRQDTVARLVHDHLQGGQDRSAMLWNLLVLETWHREVVESRS